MRFFLYTYATRENFDFSKRAGVFGTWKDQTGLATKVRRLSRGDLIVIRNGRRRSHLEFFGVGLWVMSTIKNGSLPTAIFFGKRK